MIARRDARRREDAATQAELMRQRAMEESIQAFRVSVADVLRRVEAELESTTGAADRMSSIATSAQSKMEGVSSASRQLSSGSVSIASAVEQLAASVSEISRCRRKPSRGCSPCPAPRHARKARSRNSAPPRSASAR